MRRIFLEKASGMLKVKRKLSSALEVSGFGAIIAGIAFAAWSATAVTQRSTPASPAPATDPGHVRYSPLTQIDAKNVNQLKPVWVYDTGAKGRGWEETPLVVEGVMYLSIPGGASAVDPETGKEIWRFTPTGLSRPGRDRGVAYWPGDGTLAPRIVYTISDRLYALDAKTGQAIADFGNKGYVNLRDEVADKYPNAQYSITSPTGIYKNLAIVAPSTQEFGSKGLVVLAVNVGESKRTVRKYLEQHPRKTRIVLTDDTNLAAMFAAKVYPIYVVIDREGNVAGKQNGAGGERALRSLVAEGGLKELSDDD